MNGGSSSKGPAVADKLILCSVGVWVGLQPRKPKSYRISKAYERYYVYNIFTTFSQQIIGG